MSGLDEKGLRDARDAFNEVSGNPTCDDPIGVAISAYLAATTPTDVGELVERLRQAAETSASGRGEWYQLVHRCREAATALERVTRERDEALAENTRLRAALAQSELPCVYCSLPKDEWAKCAQGFPGCGRADDAMGCPELGAAMRAEAAEAKLAEARKVIDRYWKGAYWAAMADHDADVVNAFLEETK